MIKNIINKNRNKIFNSIADFVYIIVGSLLIALGTNLFLLPNKMTTGGASVIATIFYHLFNIPMGITILVINIPLFIISILKLGVKFNIKTILSTVFLSVFLELFNLEKTSSLDLFTSCVFGGIIVGFGIAIIFKAGASSGGSDLLAQIIYKVKKVSSVSKVLLIIEIVIITSIILVFKDINVGLYSIMSLAISTRVVDIVFEGVYYTKVVTIITKKSDKVIPHILNDLKRGATVTNSIGAHSKEEITTITCVITTPQIAKIKELIRENDSHALMYITNVNEAIGSGFKEL